MAVNDRIERFLARARRVQEEIEGLGAGGYRNILVKASYVALLDGLTRAVFPRSSGHRKRFVSLVRHFGDWDAADHVSLPHLVALLSKARDPAYSKVRGFASAELGKWAQGDLVQLSRDPNYATVFNLWPQDRRRQPAYEGISLEFLKHCELLYTYRNSLVHELREPGAPIEAPEDQMPYYLSGTAFAAAFPGDIDQGYQFWELTYPVPFFASLVTRTLTNLETYLKGEQLDPLSEHRFGSHWLPELN